MLYLRLQAWECRFQQSRNVGTALGGVEMDSALFTASGAMSQVGKEPEEPADL